MWVSKKTFNKLIESIGNLQRKVEYLGANVNVIVHRPVYNAKEDMIILSDKISGVQKSISSLELAALRTMIFLGKRTSSIFL
jgi:hypothetical protein